MERHWPLFFTQSNSFTWEDEKKVIFIYERFRKFSYCKSFLKGMILTWNKLQLDRQWCRNTEVWYGNCRWQIKDDFIITNESRQWKRPSRHLSCFSWMYTMGKYSSIILSIIKVCDMAKTMSEQIFVKSLEMKHEATCVRVRKCFRKGDIWAQS